MCPSRIRFSHEEIADLRDLISGMIRGIVDACIAEERERIAAVIAMTASQVPGPAYWAFVKLAENIRESK